MLPGSGSVLRVYRSCTKSHNGSYRSYDLDYLDYLDFLCDLDMICPRCAVLIVFRVRVGVCYARVLKYTAFFG